MALKKAQRKSKKFKGSIQGASGSGKTFTALKIVTKLVSLTDPGKRIAVIDTENGAELYAPPFDFDVDDDWVGKDGKVNYHPRRLIEKLETIRKAGVYGAVIVDSATHIYKEKGGLLSLIDDICDAERAKGRTANSFAAWKTVDPIYRELMSYVRNYPLHLVLCIRAKQAYEKAEGGKGSMKKVGMEPEFRDGFEFEMDAQFSIDEDHVMVPRKHRLQDYLDGKVFKTPGDDVAEIIFNWSSDGAEPAPVELPPEVPAVNAPGAPPPPAFNGPSAKETVLAAIAAASDKDALAAVSKQANALKNAKEIVGDDWKEVGAAFSARLKALAEAPASPDTEAAAQ